MEGFPRSGHILTLHVFTRTPAKSNVHTQYRELTCSSNVWVSSFNGCWKTNKHTCTYTLICTRLVIRFTRMYLIDTCYTHTHTHIIVHVQCTCSSLNTKLYIPKWLASWKLPKSNVELFRTSLTLVNQGSYPTIDDNTPYILMVSPHLNVPSKAYS